MNARSERAAIEAFVEEFKHLADQVIARHLRTIVHADRDDVRSDGYLGLYQAAQTWDPALGSASAYVRFRVDAAIVDGWRQRLGRYEGPTRTARLAQRHAIRLDAPLHRDGTGTWADVVHDGSDLAEDVVDHLTQPAIAGAGARALLQLLQRLPPRQHEALVATYLHGRRLHEVAADWGVTESRVTQIRNAALRQLRTWLDVDPTPRRVKPCGTVAAHTRHVKRGEIPCALCRIARNRHQSPRQQQRRAAQRAQGAA